MLVAYSRVALAALFLAVVGLVAARCTRHLAFFFAGIGTLLLLFALVALLALATAPYPPSAPKKDR